jgi:hypothetical protein
MVFIGYPVNIEEAIRLFKLPIDIESFDSDWKWCQYIDEKIKKYGLHFYPVDKNLWVIGLKCNKYLGEVYSSDEIYNKDHSYKTVDECVTAMMELKAKVSRGMKLAGVDMSEIEITHMEGENIILSYPEPFFINGETA